MKALYTAEATAHGGREGHVRSSDGILDTDLRRPKEMGGPARGNIEVRLLAEVNFARVGQLDGHR